MEIDHIYFQSKAFELPKKLVTCYFSRRCHAGIRNVRLLSEELIPRELLRHPEYASLLQEGGFPAVNTSFNQPTEGFDAIAIDFQDPANQSYVLRFYLRDFQTRFKATASIYKATENWPNQTVEIQAFSSRIPFRLRLAMRRDDPARIFLTLCGPKNTDTEFDVEIFEHNIPHYGIPPRKRPDLNAAFQKKHLNYEILNSIIQLVKAEQVFPERKDMLHLRLDLTPICDLISLPVLTDQRLQHMREMKEKAIALEEYQIQQPLHYELVCNEELFFTQGLKFYKIAVHQAIDLLIENGNKLLGSKECGQIKDWLVNDLFELIRQVGEQLAELDPNDQLWHAIRIKQDSSLGENSIKSAQVVMLRNALVELVRCWKELELHPAFKRGERISDTALREVGNKWDCDEFSLIKIAEEDHSAISCFCYKGDVTAASEKVHEFCVSNIN